MSSNGIAHNYSDGRCAVWVKKRCRHHKHYFPIESCYRSLLMQAISQAIQRILMTIINIPKTTITREREIAASLFREARLERKEGGERSCSSRSSSNEQHDNTAKLPMLIFITNCLSLFAFKCTFDCCLWHWLWWKQVSAANCTRTHAHLSRERLNGNERCHHREATAIITFHYDSVVILYLLASRRRSPHNGPLNWNKLRAKGNETFHISFP